MKERTIKGAAVFAASLFLITGTGVLTGCTGEPAVNPTAAVEEKENFVTQGSTQSRVVETAGDLFFKYKNDFWRLDKNTDHIERLRGFDADEFSGAFWVYNNNMYYWIAEQVEHSGSSIKGLYKMDLDTKTEKLIAELPTAPNSIYASDGLLYVEGYNLRNIYRLTEQGDIESAVEKEETIYGLIPEGCSTAGGDLLPYITDQYGYMVLSNGENLVLADSDGKNAKSVPQIPSSSQMLFSNEAIYAVIQQEDSYVCQKIDVSTQEVSSVFETEIYPTLMQYRDGVLYYMENDFYSIVGGDSNFYSLDIKTNAKEMIASLKREPGTVNYYDLYGSFYVTESKMYHEVIKDYGVYMTNTSLSDGIEPVVIETALYQSDINKLGSIEGENMKTPCSCGEKTVSEVYVERLKLSGTSDAAAKINKALEEVFNEKLSYNPIAYEEEESWIHDEAFTPYTFTYQMGDIHYLDDRYLCFEMQGYEYSGGAHGMPYRDIFLFDLETGKRLGLADILDMPEEKLGAIVSSYFRELSEQTAFSFSSPEDLEREVMESVSFDSPFYLTSEGLVFFYQPYEIASYASGFPEVTIPYSELQMKIELKKAAGVKGKN